LQVGYLHVQGIEEPIYKEKTTLGRDPLSDIVIDAAVSINIILVVCSFIENLFS